MTRSIGRFGPGSARRARAPSASRGRRARHRPGSRASQWPAPRSVTLGAAAPQRAWRLATAAVTSGERVAIGRLRLEHLFVRDGKRSRTGRNPDARHDCRRHAPVTGPSRERPSIAPLPCSRCRARPRPRSPSDRSSSSTTTPRSSASSARTSSATASRRDRRRRAGRPRRHRAPPAGPRRPRPDAPRARRAGRHPGRPPRRRGGRDADPRPVGPRLDARPDRRPRGRRRRLPAEAVLAGRARPPREVDPAPTAGPRRPTADRVDRRSSTATSSSTSTATRSPATAQPIPLTRVEFRLLPDAPRGRRPGPHPRPAARRGLRPGPGRGPRSDHRRPHRAAARQARRRRRARRATSRRSAASAIAPARSRPAVDASAAGSRPGSRWRRSPRPRVGLAILAIGVTVVGGRRLPRPDDRGRRLGRARPGDVRPVGHDRRPRRGRRGRHRQRRPRASSWPGCSPGRWPRSAAAARRIADGDYAARVPREGPEEIASLADSFNQMAASLERQETMRRDFIANAAHELRTPLTNLQGYLEALRDGVIVADRATYDSLLGRGRAARPAVALARRAGRGRRGDAPAGARASSTSRPPSGRRSSWPSRRSSGPACASTVERPGPAAGPRQPRPPRPGPGATCCRTPRATRRPAGTVTVRAERRPADLLVSIANTGDGDPAGRPRPRLRALLPGREVARPGARRRGHRPRHRQAARRGGRRPGRRRVARRARRASGSACPG